MRSLLLQTCDDYEHFRALMAEVGPWHARYAAQHDADYELFFGRCDPACMGIWNRHRQILDAFAAGYDKVVYMDVDCLVVRPEVSVFAESGDDVPLEMVYVPWRAWRGRSLWEDGVIVANNVPAAAEVLSWVWERRHAEPLAHHQPDFFDQNWLFDFIHERIEVCNVLEGRFNCVPGAPWCAAEKAVILGWHGWTWAEKVTQIRARLRSMLTNSKDET